MPRTSSAAALLLLVLGLFAAIPAMRRVAAQPVAPGSVLLEDSFEDPGAGMLPPFGYTDGEYAIVKAASAAGVAVVRLPGTHTDTTLAIDARLVGESSQAQIALACRRSTDAGPSSQYRFTVLPDAGRFDLSRWDSGRGETLAAGFSAAIRPGAESNRIELACAGNIVSGSVNGEQVAAAQDIAYAEGELSFGVGGPAESAAEARFDNLRVTAAQPIIAPMPAVGCLAPPIVYHVHAHLSIFVDGRPVVVPANLGIRPGCIAAVHTHDITGILHLEGPAPRLFTLADVFQVWGQPLGATHLLDRTAADPSEIVAHVNGELYTGSPETIPLASHTVVVLQIGQPLVSPPPFRFPPAYSR